MRNHSPLLALALIAAHIERGEIGELLQPGQALEL